MRQQVNYWLLGFSWMCLMTCFGCKGLNIEPCSGQESVTKVELRCRKNAIISEFHVTSQIFDQNCTGEDPDLIANRNQCYWNNTCKMKFPVRKMITCHKAEDEDPDSSCPCFYQEAKRLLVQKAKCARKKDVITMCEGSEVIKDRAGMIRSHEIYPWNLGANHVNRTCRKIKGLEKQKKTLAVGIRMNELGKDESLVLNTAHETYTIESGANDLSFKFKKEDGHGYLNITFNGGGDSANFGGFVICFKELKKKQLDNMKKSSKHVCDFVAKKDASVKVHVGKFSETCLQKGKSRSKKKRHTDTDQCCCDDKQCDSILDINS